MKRFTGVALILLLTAFVMAGCSRESGTEGQVEAPADRTGEQAVQPRDPGIMERSGQAVDQAAERTGQALGQAREEGAETLEQARESTSHAMDRLADGATQMDEIRGTLVQTEQGVSLFSDEGNFVLAGQDLAEMVGKDVLVTGTVQEGEGLPVLNVSSISVVE